MVDNNNAFRQQQQQQPLLLLSAGYLRGLIFIVLVAIIWAASSVFVQFLYSSPSSGDSEKGLSFNSPFLLTYIGTSLFTLWIPIKLISSSTSSLSSPPPPQPHTQRRRRRGRRRRSVDENTTTYHNVPVVATPSSLESPDDHDNKARQNDFENNDMEEDEDDDENDGIQLHYPHHHHATTTMGGDDDLNASEQQHGNDDSSSNNSQSLNNANSQRGFLMPTSDEVNVASDCHWTIQQHIMVALQIAPIWFMANWSYNASLAYTSITSSTVLASTGSVFTFMFAVYTGDESFNSYKLSGVLLGVIGCLLTALHDASSSSSSSTLLSSSSSLVDTTACVNVTDTLNSHATIPFCNDTNSTMTAFLLIDANTNNHNDNLSLFGDCLGLLSAIGYGMYAVQTRVLCPHQEDLYSMELLLGFIGLINAIALSPVALYSYYYLIHQQQQHHDDQNNNNSLTWLVFGCLILKGLLDNALSDYLWLRAVILTSATVATVGLGLTIPLAFLSDLYLSFTSSSSSSVLSLTSIVGAMAVLMGFVLVNVGMNQENNNANQNTATTTPEGNNHVLVGEEDNGDDNDNEPLGFIDNHHDSDAANGLISVEGDRNGAAGSPQTRSDIL